MGIPPSPIQAPQYDIYGTLRVDDPNVASPPGLGSNVFKDRGAIEAADLLGPTAALVNPVDNDAAGLDRNPAANQVLLVAHPMFNFTIQLNDQGTGVDDSTVAISKFTITRTVGGVTTPLIAGTDFTMAYDTTSKLVQLIPTIGVWSNGTYTITLNNSTNPIRDKAAVTSGASVVGNPLQPNDPSGATQFVIQLSTTAPSTWQNPVNKFDVNNSGFVSGIDALLIINRLLNGQTGPLLGTPSLPVTSSGPDYYLDVNGDGILSALDALQVINYLLNPTPGVVSAATTSTPTSSATTNATSGSVTTSAASPAVLASATHSVVTTLGSADAVAVGIAATQSTAATTTSATTTNSASTTTGAVSGDTATPAATGKRFVQRSCLGIGGRRLAPGRDG